MNLKFIRFRNTATRLIKENGAVFKMRRTSDPVEDPIEGTVTPGEIQVQDVIAVILPAGSDSDTELYLSRNSNLSLSNVKKVLIANQGLSWEPKPLEEFEYKGEWWQYDNNSNLDPDAQTDILYKGFIRRR